MKKNYMKFLLTGCFTFGLSVLTFGQSPIQNANLRKATSSPVKSLEDAQNVDNKYAKQFEAIRNSYDQERLAALQLEFVTRYGNLKNDAEKYALANNIPFKIHNEDGTYAELQRLAEDGTPIYYSTYNVDAAESTRADYLNTGGGLGLNLNGDGLTAHVWDQNLARATHVEYDGAGGTNRFSSGDGTTATNFHSGHVMGTMIASGVDANAKGMAWQADGIGYDWNNDVAEATTAAAGGMLVSNHSYGFGLRDAGGNPQLPDYFLGGYITDSRDWDQVMFNAPFYLMVVAAGNDGNDNTAVTTPLDGENNYDKLSGHSTSKNNLVVANGQDANINGSGTLNNVTRNSSSSEGPTDDYRVKPDIMGNGSNVYSTYVSSNTAYASITGTSMASPNVAGSLLLLQEHYNNVNGSFMRAATLKGLTLHTADDVTPSNTNNGTTVALTGPDATTGWGLMNSKFAAEAITTAGTNGDAIINELSLSNGATYQITIESDGVNPLLASVSWTDPAGVASTLVNDNNADLINDLDIRVSNGTTYVPWRMNGVTTNGTGDNIKDPYERIDINGAAGFYTLTVTHKGTLNGGSQNFSLIVTGAKESAATPQIGFNSTIGNNIEGSDCGFIDIIVPVNIAQGASEDADVAFTVNGGTAIEGTDFDLMTANVTFNAGSTVSQNMTLRIYSDGFVEGDETFTIDLAVTTIGDATANTNADSMTFTITDDDVIPAASQTTTIVSYDMDAGSWGTYDGEATPDGEIFGSFTGITLAGIIEGTFWASATDLTILGGTGTADPNNYVFSPAITIPANATSVDFNFAVGSLADSEHWGVYWFTELTVASIESATLLAEGDTTTDTAGIVTVNTTGLEGQTGYFTMRHFNSTGNTGALLFDTFSAVSNITTPIQTVVNNGTTNDQMNLPGAGTVYTSDSATGDIMMDITNNNAFDYGCIDIAVARAGTGAQVYNGSVAPNLVMNKTFYVNPTNVATSGGDVTITFYFTEAEIAGWEGITGLSRTTLTCLRDDAGAVTFAPDQNGINATETVNLTVGAFGTDVTLTGTFTGLTGGFVFGPDAAFQSLCFTPRVYLQGPLGTGTGMSDGLRAGGLIPTTSPYADAVTAPASVFTVTGNDAIVDWVWLEVREVGNNTNILASTSALVQRDGDIVNYVDGTGTIKLGLASGNYLLSVNHRNHLGVMSGTLALDASCKVIDFTDGSLTTFGTNAQNLDMGSGLYSLWRGDATEDGQITFVGATIDVDLIKDLILNDAGNIFNAISYTVSNVYSMNDINMDGDVKFIGADLDPDLIKDAILAHPANIFDAITFIITEQLP